MNTDSNWTTKFNRMHQAAQQQHVKADLVRFFAHYMNNDEDTLYSHMYDKVFADLQSCLEYYFECHEKTSKFESEALAKVLVAWLHEECEIIFWTEIDDAQKRKQDFNDFHEEIKNG